MTRNLVLVSALALTFPIAVDAPVDSVGTDGRETRLSVAGGAGAYALITRDCEGNMISNTPMGFRELGAQIDQEVAGPLHVGVRGGVQRDEVKVAFDTTNAIARARGAPQEPSGFRNNRYVNPYVSLEGRRAGIGFGRVFSDHEFVAPMQEEGNTYSGHLRLGPPNKYFSIALMENVPLYSGGGYFDMGIGFSPDPKANCWIGLSGGPYDGPGLGLRTSWQMHPRLMLDLSARLGTSEGLGQNGVGIGISSRLGGSSRSAPGDRSPTETAATDPTP